MINESNLLNFYCNGIYDSTKAMTETEIIMKIIEKLNMVILNFNDLESKTLKNLKEINKQVNYYIDDGIKTEISKQIGEMVENGYFNSIVSNELFYDLNDQITNNTSDIELLREEIQLIKNKL